MAAIGGNQLLCDQRKKQNRPLQLLDHWSTTDLQLAGALEEQGPDQGAIEGDQLISSKSSHRSRLGTECATTGAAWWACEICH
jgi:hypothetical protein